MPAWTSELIVACMATLTVAALPATAHNLRLLHINSIAQSILCAVFQLLFAYRLASEHGSWMTVFSPWYMAMFVQMALHHRKEMDSRGRRPGFPLGVLHLLALVVSFKLESAFNYGESSWVNVLWPLWGVAGFFIVSLLMGICCGLPCLMRREAQVRCHLLCMFSALLLLLCSVLVPALMAAVRLAEWLDGDTSISSRAILIPYLIANSVVLLLLCVSLAIVSFSSAVRVRGGVGGDGTDGADEDGMAELFSALPAPTALVRESSTLFRRVSDATMDKYKQRHHHHHGDVAVANGRLSAEEMSEHQANDSLLSRHRSRGDSDSGADDRPSHSSHDDDLPPAGSAMRDVLPPSIELVEIRLDQATAEPGGGGGAVSPTVVVDTDDAGGDVADTLPAAAPPRADGANASDSGVRKDGPLLEELEEEEDGLGGEFCWICCQGERNAVLLECGHGGICYDCATRCARKRPPLCPMCRSRISQIAIISGPPELVDGEVLVQAASARDRLVATSEVAAVAAAASTASAVPSTPPGDAESDSHPLMP
mmetsp:Transcript_319/g.836  ORF Transcript_319/g.836 Transcript_319/m.836 type:complete len:540 (+) Transcript_319:450-2069(+)